MLGAPALLRGRPVAVRGAAVAHSAVGCRIGAQAPAPLCVKDPTLSEVHESLPAYGAGVAHGGSRGEGALRIAHEKGRAR